MPDNHKREVMTNKAERQQENTTSAEEIAQQALQVVDEEGEKVKGVDPAALQEFTNTVFHSGLLEDEHIMCWRATNKPGLPMSYKQAARRMASSKGASGAWYYGTAATRLSPEGDLRNKKSLFSSLHVVVLDDIGTKVAKDSLPEAFKEPSYIIESSPGNYQYGLVLEEPVEDYAQASALIQMVYTSGCSDAGGRMPTKLVRLPFGINGKPGEKHDFPVTLHSLTEKRYTPEQILTAIDADITWDEVVADPTRVDKNLRTSSVGAVAWQPLSQAVTTDGATDAILDWFEANDMVQSYNEEWITVRCPWAHHHTSGDDLAGYSPLGMGTGRWRNIRSFKCFHEHCAEQDASSLIDVLHEQGQIDTMYPVYDPSWPMRRRLVVEVENKCVMDITKSRPEETRVDMGLAPTVYCQTAPAPGKKATKPVPLFGLYRASPEKLVVQGVRYNPAGEQPLYRVDDTLFLNSYQSPNWGTGNYDPAAAEVFFGHMKFLCGDEPGAYEYLRNWFACKVHDPAFRGNAIAMTTPAFGVGRDTLVTMMGMVLGGHNVAGLKPDQLADKYNDYLMKQLVVCSETSDGAKGGQAGYYQFYETLKDMIDPSPLMRRINPKFGKQFDSLVYTSFIFLSNHENMLRVAMGDRRVYVIANPDKPKPPLYYQQLRKAMESENFARDIYRYIIAEIEPDFNTANAPAPASAAKSRMYNSSRTSMEVGVQAILDVLDTPVVATTAVAKVLDNSPEMCDAILGGNTPAKQRALLSRQIKALTVNADDNRYRIDGVRTRIRWRKGVTLPADFEDSVTDAIKKYQWASLHPDEFAAAVAERMEDIWEGKD